MLTRYRKHKGNGKPLCGWRSLTLIPCLAKFKPSWSSAWLQLPLTDLCEHRARTPAGVSQTSPACFPWHCVGWTLLRAPENSTLLWHSNPGCWLFHLQPLFYSRNTYFSISCSTFGNCTKIKTSHMPLFPVKAGFDAGKYFCNAAWCLLN